MQTSSTIYLEEKEKLSHSRRKLALWKLLILFRQLRRSRRTRRRWSPAVCHECSMKQASHSKPVMLNCTVMVKATCWGVHRSQSPQVTESTGHRVQVTGHRETLNVVVTYFKYTEIHLSLFLRVFSCRD